MVASGLWTLMNNVRWDFQVSTYVGYKAWSIPMHFAQGIIRKNSALVICFLIIFLRQSNFLIPMVLHFFCILCSLSPYVLAYAISGQNTQLIQLSGCLPVHQTFWPEELVVIFCEAWCSGCWIIPASLHNANTRRTQSSRALTPDTSWSCPGRRIFLVQA